MIELPDRFKRDEKALTAYIDRLASDFVFFVEELWKDREYDSFAPIGDMERDICRYVADSSNNLRGILGPRGVGKSHWGAAAYASWRLLRDPDTKILIVSKSKIPGARDTARLIRGWLNRVWFLQHLNPIDAASDQATDQTFQFDVAGSKDSRSPSLMVQGIDGMITSTRAHLVIGDDVETRENTKTLPARLDLDEKVKEFSTIAKYGQREVLYFGTYHNEESLYLKLAKRGYQIRTYPFTYPLPGERFLNLAPLITRNLAAGAAPGSPTFSHRYSMDDVAENKKEGRRHWLMQYQLVSNLAESNKYPLRLSDLIVFDGMTRDKAPISIAYGKTNSRGGSTALEHIPIVGWDQDRLHGPIMFDPQLAPYTGTKAFIDPAGRGTDRTGVSIVAHLSAFLYVKCCIGLPGGADSESMNRIASLCRQHGATDIYYEQNIDTFDTFGQLFSAALRRHFLEPGTSDAFPHGWKASLTPRRARGQKEVRIVDSLEPVMSNHQLVMHPSCLMPTPDEDPAAELQYQISRLTLEAGSLTEDGAIDSLSQCIAEWLHVLRLDTTKASQTTREREYKKSLLEQLGWDDPRRKPPRWFTHSERP